MDKIAFLVADELMQQSVATIIQTYNEKLTQHSFRIKIEIIDFPRLIDQARDLIRQGAKVIITNSGSHQILTKVIDTIPILCLFSSTNDALYTLRSIAPKYKKIHLLLNENFMFNKDACPEELRKKIVFYRRYSLDKTHLELLAQVRQIPVTPDTAIVGCPLLPQIAHPAPMPIYSIRPSESTMLSVLLYAQELLVFQKKDSQQLSMMPSYRTLQMASSSMPKAALFTISINGPRPFWASRRRRRTCGIYSPIGKKGKSHRSRKRSSTGRRIRSSPIPIISLRTVRPITS